jgi:hypothetical protein
LPEKVERHPTVVAEVAAAEADQTAGKTCRL